MKHIRTFASILVVAALCLGMLACTTSQLVTTLDAVANAVSVALPIILNSSAVKFDDVTKATVVSYLKAVDTAVIQTGTELQSSDSDAVKAAKIVQCFAQASFPVLPANTPPAVTLTVGLVSAAIDSLLADLAPSKVAAHKRRWATHRSLPARLSTKEQQTVLHAVSTAASSLTTLSEAK